MNDINKLWQVILWRDDEVVATFYCESEAGTYELQLAFSAENEEVDVIHPKVMYE